MAATNKPDIPILFFEQPEAFTSWLEAHPDFESGVWLKFAKKGKGLQSINYDQALEVALCYGWIDSVPQKLDDTYYLQKFTPRRKRSVWSLRNTKLVEQLTADGRMRPAGQREIDAAKADGRWDAAYSAQSNFELPPDFLAAVNGDSVAVETFASLTKAQRYTIYYQLQDAKKPETRAARLDKFVAQLAAGEKPH